MDNIKVHTPTFFTLDTIKRLADANGAVRELRKAGCRVLSIKLAHTADEKTEIVIDRNVHDRRFSFRGIDIKVDLAARAVDETRASNRRVFFGHIRQ